MILVDSDVLIAHLRGVAAARNWLVSARNDGPLRLSVVSVAEVIGGMRSVERREVWRLLASFRVEPATEIIARRAGDMMRRYRRSHNRIGLGDYLRPATGDPQRAAFPHVRGFATTVCDNPAATAGGVTHSGLSLAPCGQRTA